MTAPDPADVAGAVQAIRAASACNDASDEQIAAAVIAWAAPRIRQQAAAQERERWLALIRQADDHIIYLSNLLSDHTSHLAWDDLDLDAAIAALIGDSQ